MPDPRQQGTLAASGQSGEIHGKRADIALSGTWVGTVNLQRYVSGGWNNTGDSWTANAIDVVDGATHGTYRLDWTRTSGSLVYDIRGG